LNKVIVLKLITQQIISKINLKRIEFLQNNEFVISIPTFFVGREIFRIVQDYYIRSK